MGDRSEQRRAWASSGAMALTGRREGPPLVAPDAVVDRIVALGASVGSEVLPLLAERAAIAGLTRGGDVSCGGATRLLPARDGWIAIALARPDDLALLPAWLDVDAPAGDPWAVVAAAVAERSMAEVMERGAILGLPLGAVPPGPPGGGGAPIRRTRVRAEGGLRRARPLVVDLSSLWAGPLCGRILAERGARVVKVESRSRPDGARRGPVRFFDVMHGGREGVALELRDPVEVERLRRLMLAADVVIEASRPRALEQLGIDAAGIVRHGPSVWVSITGHGREGADRDRVAFGDDAAAAGGLVAWDGAGPCFVADAVADPLAGVAAAAAAVAALDAGGGWILDVAMTAVAASIAGADTGQPWRAGADDEVAPPVPPAPTGRAPDLGEHTDAVLRELGCR